VCLTKEVDAFYFSLNFTVAMKKSIFIFSYILFFQICAFSQIQGKVTYRTILSKNGYAPIQEELIFNNQKSIYRLVKKSNPEKVVVDEQTGSVSLNVQIPDSVHYFIFSDLNSKTITSKVFLTEDNGETYKAYNTKEPFSITWTLSKSETLKIGSYNCNKATADFRGRRYMAWYTEQIPVSAGPWKFNGLPGLILKVEDDSGDVKFYAEEISIPSNTQIIVPASMQRDVISIQQFAKLRKIAEDKSDKAFRAKVLSKLPRGSTIKLSEDGTNEIEKIF
jgi:GLPGLI family protein